MSKIKIDVDRYKLFIDPVEYNGTYIGPRYGGPHSAFWKNPDIIARLRWAFSIGANVKEACYYANISRSSYYAYKKENPDMVQMWEDTHLLTILRARSVIVDAIFAGDVKTSMWYLERTVPSFMSITRLRHIVNNEHVCAFCFRDVSEKLDSDNVPQR